MTKENDGGPGLEEILLDLLIPALMIAVVTVLMLLPG